MTTPLSPADEELAREIGVRLVPLIDADQIIPAEAVFAEIAKDRPETDGGDAE